MTQPSLTERLLAKWAGDGVRRRPGAEPARLAEFEGIYGVRLPADLREYLLVVDGMDEGACDLDLISFWPLGRIRPPGEIWREPPMLDYFGHRSVPEFQSFFCFADWAQEGHVYCIQLHPPDVSRPNRIVELPPGPSPRMAFASFGEFAEAYLSGLGALWS